VRLLGEKRPLFFGKMRSPRQYERLADIQAECRVALMALQRRAWRRLDGPADAASCDDVLPQLHTAC
jgi:hypothetical protein